MHFYLVVDSDGILRIEEEEGGQVTASLMGDEARILSIFVPEKGRRTGIGRMLLSLLSQEAHKRNIRHIVADFAESMSDIQGLLKACGYTMEAGAPVMSIDMEKLLSYNAVKKLLKQKNMGEHFISLWQYQLTHQKSVEDIFKELKLLPEQMDFSRYQLDMSGFVYNDAGKREAVILCSDYGTWVHVERLDVEGEPDSPAFMVAARGMIEEIMERDGADHYSRLTYLALDGKLGQALGKISEKLLGTIFAQKEVEPPLEQTELTVDIFPDEKDDWIEELREVPFAYSISFTNACRRAQKSSRNCDSGGR